jgi:hypothetical protein
MSSSYFGMDVFCQFKAGAPEFEAELSVHFTVHTEPEFLKIFKCSWAESLLSRLPNKSCRYSLLYTMTFEKTALLEKSTFQPPENV